MELLEAHLARIDKLNPRLNAITSLDATRARQQARQAEALVMKKEGKRPLLGVPVTIKSSIDVAGLRSEAGTNLRASYVATTDAPLVARLRAAGAIVLGTTNVPEMLMAYHTENTLYGRTNSPWALDRTPGGSSGGEAAALAAGLSAGGVGSDGGGSIRVPAHFSGICGLKPTPGRIPATGHYPPSQGPAALLGVVGPMARTVEDLELLFSVMAGPDRGDPLSAPLPLRPAGEDEIRGLRIGVFVDDGRTPVTPETAAAVSTAAEALKQAGCRVADFRPTVLEPARLLWNTLFCQGAALVLRPLMNGRESELPILKEFFSSDDDQSPLTAESLFQALVERDQLRGQLLAQMEEFPVLLCPVCSVPAFRHGERAWRLDGQQVRTLDAMSYTEWFNLLGNPAAVVPVGRSP
ncbi:MAG: amidase, partial [Terriglobia bacterium]